MLLGEKMREIKHAIAQITGDREAYWIARDVAEHVMGYSEIDLLMKKDEELSDFICTQINNIVARILTGEPIQLILGWARFAGNRFKVTGDTLIPRPETQELTDLIIDKHANETDLNIIDIGTGSGCIAITLARGLKFANVEAIDISTLALNIAKENAKSLKANVKFREQDALKMPQAHSIYNIIVSNPPYIANQERKDMSPTVLDYEPSTALFVPNEDPLLFYREISKWGKKALRVGGYIYFEINPLYAKEVKDMMTEMGYCDVSIIKDMHSKNRFAVAINAE
ncbi:MAG: peptide chain release factor N(5)-glutamine methyltransferase [Bacteroidales bacterium]|nr:peptide chain release factor N(5)-glutamine methyltransferase [Bacteroidales bacterium]